MFCPLGFVVRFPTVVAENITLRPYGQLLNISAPGTEKLGTHFVVVFWVVSYVRPSVFVAFCLEFTDLFRAGGAHNQSVQGNTSVKMMSFTGWHYLSNATCLIRPHLSSTALPV